MPEGTPTISVIIPFRCDYGADLAALFASVAQQVGVVWSAFEFILVNDGGAALDPHVLAPAPAVTIRQYTLTRSLGAGLARQFGMDLARGPYLMFMDADDVLESATAFARLLAATADTPDLVKAPFTAEVWRQGQLRDKQYPASDGQAVMGKLFRADFLAALGLRWHPQLRVYEDTYFVTLAHHFAQHVVRLSAPVYRWRANPVSTGRRGAHGFADQGDEWVRSQRYQLAFLRERDVDWWQHEFFRFLGTCYLHERVFVARDQAAMDAQLQLALHENCELWVPAVSPALIQQIAAYYRERRSYYHHVSLADFPQYLAKLEALRRRGTPVKLSEAKS
ncbi:glycosyltransferase family 2 protein [Lacticaseibacillus daqingensis]|uniref:glycosyltransferase family 2 protein n=1 Tax=Lacticaseibacillus daqingensis TaxID=2486014 RepID=UPI000F7AD881|nr:glycosyltransferase family A protein [Lacticaseibacillus daqingensis]